MNDGTGGTDGEAPPTTAEIRRRSVIPRTGDPLIYPSGKIAQDPKRYNMPDTPATVEESLPVVPAEEFVAPSPSDDHAVESLAPVVSASATPVVPEPMSEEPSPPVPADRKKWLALAGGGLALVAVVVALAVALGGRDPLVVASESPSPSPSPSPTAVELVGFGLLDDGIDDGDYPAPAPNRGEGFPAAYAMEEWVWDKTGPGWAVSVVWTGRLNGSAGASAAWVYLHSPEGAAFELFQLPEAYREAPLVAGWHEDQRAAWIVAQDGTEAALFDLTTGEPDELSFRMSSGSSQWVELATALPDNTELWVARGNDWSETRVFVHQPFGEWTRVLPQSDFYYTDPWTGVSLDGERVMFNIHSADDSGYASARSGSPGRPHSVVYNLATGTESFVEPHYPSWADYCSFAGWAEVRPQVNCWTHGGVSRDEYFELDLAGNLVSIPSYYQAPMAKLGDLADYTDPESNLKFVSDTGVVQTFELRLVRETQEVVLATQGDRWSRAGIHVSELTEVQPGVFRIDTYGSGSFLVDTINGVMTTLYATYPEPPGGSLPFSIVHFGEGAGAIGRYDYFGG